MKSEVGEAGESSVFRHCEGVLEKAPNTAKGARKIYVPLITGVLVIVVLSALAARVHGHARRAADPDAGIARAR